MGEKKQVQLGKFKRQFLACAYELIAEKRFENESKLCKEGTGFKKANKKINSRRRGTEIQGQSNTRQKAQRRPKMKNMKT